MVVVHLFFWIGLGALVGWITRLVMERDPKVEASAHVMVGIIGSFIGVFMLTVFNVGETTFAFTLYHSLVAVIGALALLFFVGALHRDE